MFTILRMRVSILCVLLCFSFDTFENLITISFPLRGLVQSPCGKINVIMMLGGGILVHDVLQLHCQQILALVVIMHSCG